MLLSFENPQNGFDVDSDDELLLPNYNDEAFYLKEAFSTTSEILPHTPILPSIEFDEDRCESPESSDFQLEDITHPSQPSLSSQPSQPPQPSQAKDDSYISEKASHNVDYLSQRWNAKEFWASRRAVLKGDLEEFPRRRLENTLWRTWAKSFHRLPIATPESIEWQRDSDITWLYGPIVPNTRSLPRVRSFPAWNIRRPATSGIKPILKRRTAIQDLLQVPTGAGSHKRVTFGLTWVHSIHGAAGSPDLHKSFNTCPEGSFF